MNLSSKLLIGVQACIMTVVFAAPVQAAINIGAPLSRTGSVVTIKPNYITLTPVPNTTNPTPQAPTTTTPTTPAPTRTGSSVISLKGLYKQAPIPVPTPTPQPSPSPSQPSAQPAIPPATELTADEQLMIVMVNQERAAAGVAPVQVDLRLVAVARAKANDMKVNNYFDHTSPTYGSPWAMMEQVGIRVRWAGENIAGNKSVPGAMSAFMQSEGHRKNILDPKFTHMGVGIAPGSAYGTLYVQEFLQQ